MKLKKLIILSLIILFISCSKKESNNQLIIYTSIDQIFSSKIIKEFKQKSGIDVKVLYDTEASRALGLEKRLLAEKNTQEQIFFGTRSLCEWLDLIRQDYLLVITPLSKYPNF